MPVPYIGLKQPLRRETAPEVLYCTCDYRRFEADTQEAVERLHAQHVAESRNPGDHEAVPF